MTFDYKKEYKDVYRPSKKPSLITMEPITYVAVRGKGNPNDVDGAYQHAMQLLYSISFTIKMSPKAGVDLEGYFPYVVPPLEGFWSLSGKEENFGTLNKDKLAWISCIRLPEFVTSEIFAWAKEAAAAKKNTDFSAAEYLTVDEGLCVQAMHIGSYDDEPATISAMRSFAQEQGCDFDLTPTRLHHEIYLSDPRRVAPERLKTVIRIPIA